MVVVQLVVVTVAVVAVVVILAVRMAVVMLVLVHVEEIVQTALIVNMEVYINYDKIDCNLFALAH